MFCPEVLVAESIFRKNAQLADSLGIYPLFYQEAQRQLSISHLSNKYLSHAAAEFIQLTKERMDMNPFHLSTLP